PWTGRRMGIGVLKRPERGPACHERPGLSCVAGVGRDQGLLRVRCARDVTGCAGVTGCTGVTGCAGATRCLDLTGSADRLAGRAHVVRADESRWKGILLRLLEAWVYV